jgi:5-methylcytosine-specific restriction endonuclease McrA
MPISPDEQALYLSQGYTVNGPQSLIRFKVFQPDEVLPHIDFTKGRHKKGGPRRVRVSFEGKLVWMTSLRLQTFARKGFKCVTCGIEGKYFALEQHTNKNGKESPNAWHFNLYALNEANEEVLMTRDHIVPKSRGGPDTLDNSQTMCALCNNKKGNNVEGEPSKEIAT